MTAPSGRRAALTTAAVAIVLAVVSSTSASAADGRPTSPDEQPAVTPEQLAASVRVFAVEGSVRTFTVEGSVTSLETTRREARQTVVSLDTDIAFAFASATLAPAAGRRIAQLVKDAPRRSRMSITGHTDSVGAPASNLALSRRRAAAVAAAVRAARPDLVLTVTGRGEAEPVEPNTLGGEDNPAGRSKNRRVEIRFGA